MSHPAQTKQLIRWRQSFRKRLCGLFFALLLGIGVPALIPLNANAASPNKMISTGLKYYEKGDYAKALKIFVKVLNLDPSNVIAREYMLLCSKKIVREKLGRDVAETAEKEMAIDKIIHDALNTETDPKTEFDNDEFWEIKPPGIDPLSGIDNYGQPIFSSTATRTGAYYQPGVVPNQNGNTGSLNPENAEALLQQLEILAIQLRPRLEMAQAIQYDKAKGRMIVNIYLNRLFLPHSDVLRFEAYSTLNKVRKKLGKNTNKKFVFNAVDSFNPLSKEVKPDLSAQRCAVVFSYLLSQVGTSL